MKAGDYVLKSMTGYGRAQKIINGRDILVEIRSVNHRYYEYSSRIQRAYSYIDEKLKAQLKTGITRGKVEISVTINNIESKDTHNSGKQSRCRRLYKSPPQYIRGVRTQR